MANSNWVQSLTLPLCLESTDDGGLSSQDGDDPMVSEELAMV